jgi:hypothetical protein
MNFGAENPFNERLKKLYELKGIDIAEKGKSLEVAKDFFKLHIVEYSVNSFKTEYQQYSNFARQLRNHLHCANIPETIWILRYQQYFNCSADYLLGIIDAPTHEIKAIKEITGFDEYAIKKLLSWHDSSTNSAGWGKYISDIINSEKFIDLMNHFCFYIASQKLEGRLFINSKKETIDAIDEEIVERWHISRLFDSITETIGNNYRLELIHQLGTQKHD